MIEYAPFGQPGILLEDEDGAPFPEETQKLFREVAQEAHQAGLNDRPATDSDGPLREWLGEQFVDLTTFIGANVQGIHNDIGGRHDGLIDVLKLHESALKGRFGQIEQTLGDVIHHVAGPKPLTQGESAVLSALSDLITSTDDRALTRHAELLRGMIERFDMVLNAIDRIADRTDSDDTMAIAEQKAISAAFERGRQQGDADRAERVAECQIDHQAEYDRGVAAGRASSVGPINLQRLESEFNRGLTIGKAEREAELLDAGWTPPGAIVGDVADEMDNQVSLGHMNDYARRNVTAALVHELEVSTGPTDYELWRDAVLAAATVTPDLTVMTPSGDIHVHQGSQLLRRAEFFRDHLKNYPTDIPELDPADQAQETRAAANPRDLEDPPGMDDYL